MLCDMLMQLIDLETQVRSGLRVESWTKLYNLVETMLYTWFFFLEWNKRRGQGVFLGGTSRLSAHNNPLQMTLRGLTFEQSQDVSKRETKPVFFSPSAFCWLWSQSLLSTFDYNRICLNTPNIDRSKLACFIWLHWLFSMLSVLFFLQQIMEKRSRRRKKNHKRLGKTREKNVTWLIQNKHISANTTPQLLRSWLFFRYWLINEWTQLEIKHCMRLYCTHAHGSCPHTIFFFFFSFLLCSAPKSRFTVGI